jgi:ABC-type transport system involved in cytochrome c biogenesis ATPase subunit
LLRVVTGLLRSAQGTVSWRGRPIQQTRTKYQAALAYSAQEPALNGNGQHYRDAEPLVVIG